MRFLSVCSGIEAASVAFAPLGWEALAYAEIEPFPCAVLAHHYGATRPETMPAGTDKATLKALDGVAWGDKVPNVGDFTTLRDRPWIVDADLLVGGTPCQAFSLAGKRGGLDDARGNLTLEFVRLLDAIDDLRLPAGRAPCVALWENVPGVLSDKGNAFGCFLAALVGADAPLLPPRGRSWPDAGLVAGPKRTAAWRVTDAQYFGLAQRRRRVFVVAGAGEGFDPSAVLFEPEGVRRHHPPSRGAGENPAVGTLRSSDGGSDVDHAQAGHVVGALTSACGPNGHGGSGLATDKGAEAGHILACYGGNNTSSAIEVAPSLLAQPGSGYKGDFDSETFVAQSVTAFDARQSDVCIYGDRAGPLDTDGYSQAVAFALRGRDDAGAVPEVHEDGQSIGTLRAAEGGSSRDYVAFQSATEFLPQSSRVYSETEAAPTLQATGSRNGNRTPQIVDVLAAVRRLTTVECARLQGFADDYLTQVTWRGQQPPADGPQYKALGNSWAVPNVAWIGRRLAAHLRALSGSSRKDAA